MITALEAHVKDWGEKGASDGMITAEDGTIYAGDYENNSIRVIHTDGTMETLAHDPRILWPDTLSIGPDQYLYFNANQLQRQASFHKGKTCERSLTVCSAFLSEKILRKQTNRSLIQREGNT